MQAPAVKAVKVIGGYRGKNAFSCERTFQYEVNAFYGMSKFNSLLKIFAFESGRVRRKSDFSNINLYYKNIAINGPNNNFLEPKMVLDLIFDGFSCIAMVCIMQNHKKLGTWTILGNIEQKRANFCRKWVPRI